MATQLKTAKVQMDTAKRELTDYKEKAARILQVSQFYMNGGNVAVAFKENYLSRLTVKWLMWKCICILYL